VVPDLDVAGEVGLLARADRVDEVAEVPPIPEPMVLSASALSSGMFLESGPGSPSGEEGLPVAVRRSSQPSLRRRRSRSSRRLAGCQEAACAELEDRCVGVLEDARLVLGVSCAESV